MSGPDYTPLPAKGGQARLSGDIAHTRAMPIEIKIKNIREERVDIKVIKNPLFETSNLRREIFKRARAIKLK